MLICALMPSLATIIVPLILLNLQNYKEGTIINNILLEVLEDNKII